MNPQPPAPTPFALFTAISTIHDPATLRPLLDAHTAALGALGARPWSGADERPAGPLVVFVVTGGTERIVLDHVNVAAREPVLLVSHPGHNSLPASLEVLARLQQLGVRGRVHYLAAPDDGDALAELAASVRGLAVHRALRDSRIGLVGAPSDWLVASSPDPSVVRETWGPTVVPISIESLLAQPAPEVVRIGAEVGRDFHGHAECTVEPAEPDLVASGGVVEQLRRVVRSERFDAVTVRCFDLVVRQHRTGCLALSQLADDGVMAGCEGDLVSTVALLWLHHLLGATPWMANPSRVDHARGTLLLAHCTVPRGVVERYRLRSHFESGLGVGVQGEFATGPVTLVRLGGARMERLRAIEGTLVGNTDHADLCRTQVEVHVGGAAIDDLLSDPLGNHMILVPGHHATLLRRWHSMLVA